MIFDADVHLSPTTQQGKEATLDFIMKELIYGGVDKALVWMIPTYLRDVKDGNKYVYEATKRYPNKLYGFGWANVRLGVEYSKDSVKRCLLEYGMYGIKINGAQDEYMIDSKDSLLIIEEIAKHNSRLAFHVGADKYVNTHPYQVAKIAKLFPEMDILCAHMGGAGKPELDTAMIEYAKENNNIHLIGSAVSYHSVYKAINELGSHRVLFGSDTPFEYTRVATAAYKALLKDHISDADYNNVMGKNLANLLNI